jgi:hypothetical protein
MAPQITSVMTKDGGLEDRDNLQKITHTIQCHEVIFEGYVLQQVK